MESPLILINLKTYKEGIGDRAHRIAAAAETVSAESGVTIGIAPSFMEIHPLSRHYAIPVYAQHIDGISPGTGTGHILPEAVKLAGAHGTLINHSERRLTLADIEAAVSAAKRVRLETVVCTNNVPTSAAAAALSPDYVAIEPPELIGSGVSVSKADPGIIENSVAAVRKVHDGVKVLTGAGIQSGECVKIALDLGTHGVLLASSVVKADDPEKVLRELVSLL
ncbi:triosephosphate isomerase [Methanoculleus taiwanensis]|uniref:Triosephosphate isomerase n=1 Tax=Methanoculleus taiwanensis TaxID=1550565 RepID=A0A498GWE8_9EURY|nr:triose-phosphate isomerase [Methanoculleus taiwanensis]RXE55241.1 triosephosphate isomerase [Methanoculleus taiwanensis]